MKIIKKIREFEIEHQVIFFLGIMLLTILITRGIVYYLIDVNPSIFGIELHHFDYGMILLIIICLLMLFGEKHLRIYLVLTAISLGLIIDELWFIRKQIGGNNPALYNPSLIYALSLAIILALIIFLVKHLAQQSKK